MSIKTLRKRIALVAVSAMGFGLLTTTAANAVFDASGDLRLEATSVVCSAAKGITPITVNASTGAPTQTLAESAFSLTTQALSVVVPIGGQVVVNSSDNYAVIGGGFGTITSSGTATWYPLLNKYRSTDTSSDYGAGGGTDNPHEVTFDATAVGSTAITFYNAGDPIADSSVAVTSSISIEVVASCTNNLFSAKDSYVEVGATQEAANDNVDDTLVASAGASLYINIVANSAAGTPVVAGTWTATTTNGAKIKLGTSSAIPSATVLFPFDFIANTSGTQITARVKAPVSGTAASTLVTISYNGTVVASKSLTFLGEATKIVIAAQTVGKVGDQGMVWYTLQDAAGNSVPGNVEVDPTTLGTRVTAMTDLESDTGTATSAGTTLVAREFDSSVSGIPLSLIGKVRYGILTFDCSTALGSGTAAVTLRHYQDVTGAAITLPLTLSCAGGMNSFTVSMDKASYKVGEVAVLTISAKDSSGAAVNDFTFVNPANTSVTSTVAPTISAGGGTVVDAAGGAVYGALNGLAAGTKTYRIQLITAGAFNAVVNLGGKTQTVGYTVTADGVSNAEVLAAIVKLIASINEQIALLQKQLKKMSKKKK